MRFQVPQFIDVEDKVFGPFTFKQFIYIGGAIGLSFVLLKLFSKPIALLLIIPLGVFALALAFYRINNKPFIQILEAALRYFFGSRLYIWKKRDIAPKGTAADVEYTMLNVPKMGQSKLKHLFWTLDMKDPASGKEE